MLCGGCFQYKVIVNELFHFTIKLIPDGCFLIPLTDTKIQMFRHIPNLFRIRPLFEKGVMWCLNFVSQRCIEYYGMLLIDSICLWFFKGNGERIIFFRAFVGYCANDCIFAIVIPWR